MTAQRRLILEAVCESPGHVGAREIAAVVSRRAPIDLSTVYRNLQLLEDLGLIYHSHVGHSEAQYHPVSHDAHQHLVCRSCGRVEEIGLETGSLLKKRLLRDHGFDAELGHFALYGTCEACRRTPPSTR